LWYMALHLIFPLAGAASKPGQDIAKITEIMDECKGRLGGYGEDLIISTER
jgi:hypothetical protein